jgi:hypothetical protein
MKCLIIISFLFTSLKCLAEGSLGFLETCMVSQLSSAKEFSCIAWLRCLGVRQIKINADVSTWIESYKKIVEQRKANSWDAKKDTIATESAPYLLETFYSMLKIVNSPLWVGGKAESLTREVERMHKKILESHEINLVELRELAIQISNLLSRNKKISKADLSFGEDPVGDTNSLLSDPNKFYFSHICKC